MSTKFLILHKLLNLNKRDQKIKFQKFPIMRKFSENSNSLQLLAKFKIVYEDEYFVAVDKPANILSVPGFPLNYSW
jgi:23S rRNA-/tRNA-specific pseudouridylate synthase